MRFKKLKMSMAMAAMSMMMLLPAAPVFASTSDTWSVNYYKGAPTTTANPIDYAYVEYYYKYKAMAYEDGSYTIETLTIDNLSKSVSFYLHARLSAGYFRSRDRQKSNFPIK
jgi:hypothetical protein